MLRNGYVWTVFFAAAAIGLSGGALLRKGLDARRESAEEDRWRGPAEYAKKCVLTVLKSPASAKFRPVRAEDVEIDARTQEGKTLTDVRVAVDSQNGFGALVRTEFTVVLERRGSEWWCLGARNGAGEACVDEDLLNRHD